MEVLRRDIIRTRSLIRCASRRHVARAIERCYASTGADDPIIIDLSRGLTFPPSAPWIPAASQCEFRGSIGSAEFLASRPFLVGRRLVCAGRRHRRGCIVLAGDASDDFDLTDARAMVCPSSSWSRSRAGAPGPGTISAAGASRKMRELSCPIRDCKRRVPRRRITANPIPYPRAIIVSSASSIICRKARRRSRFDFWTRKTAPTSGARPSSGWKSRQDANASEEAIVLATSATLLQPLA